MKSNILTRLEALVDSLPIHKKTVVFVNTLKGESVPEETENVLLVVLRLVDDR